jgi:S1-C subfamily serine protease
VVGLVAAAVCVLAVGAAVVWWVAGRGGPAPDGDGAAAPRPEAEIAGKNVPPPNPEPRPGPPNGDPVPPVRPTAATGELPANLLANISRATALVRVELGGRNATGSGFIVRANGDTAYLVTNFHVIDIEEEPQPARPVGPPFGPPIGPPGFPGRPPGFPAGPKGFGPGFGPPGFGPPGFLGRPGSGQPAARPRPRVTVVLESGTPAEQVLPADVVAFDDEADLAVLRVTGARNLPPTVDTALDPPVAETQPVYVFGFPGGSRTVVVGRGTISGLRRDATGDLTDVHLNGVVNPGNSGGPVVDAAGRLVGVAVASVRDKQIGFAVPTAELHKMFRGGVLGAVVLQVRQAGRRVDLTGELWRVGRRGQVRGRDTVQVQIPDADPVGVPADEYVALARLTDPLHKLAGVTMHYAPAPKALPRAGADGWGPLPGARAVPLKVSDQTASAPFKLPAGSVPDATYAFQVSYADADGKTAYTQPHELRLTFPKNSRSATLRIAMATDDPSYRYVEDRLKAAFAPAAVRAARTKDGMTVEVDPVDDPNEVGGKLPVGEVVGVEGRTITVAVKTLTLPRPAAADVDQALAELKAAEPRRRTTGADKLGKAYAPLPERRVAVAAALEAQLAEKDALLRHVALRGLSIWAGPETVPGLVKALGHEETQTRRGALGVLARFKSAEAAPAIAKLLPNQMERADASAALKAIGPPAEKAVAPLVSHKDGFTAAEACRILGEIGTADSIPPLEAVLAGKPHFLVSNAATDALRAIRGRRK